MDINVRFTITPKDGKLERMMSRVPSTMRTEVVKEALRFYLRAVRDREIESDFLDAELLSDFQANISKKIDIDDMKELLGAKAVATATISSVVPQQNVVSPVSDNYDDFDDTGYDEEDIDKDDVVNNYINEDFDDDF